MKWLIALAALMLVASPVFAQSVLNPSFEDTQNDSSGGRLNPNNATIPLNWFTDYNFASAMYSDERNWSYPPDGIGYKVSFVHYHSGIKSLEVNVTDTALWWSNGNSEIAGEGGLNLTAGNNYELAFYLEKAENWIITSGFESRIAFILRDTAYSDGFELNVLNTTESVVYPVSLFQFNGYTKQNVTGGDGHIWEKFVIGFNVTTNVDNVTIGMYPKSFSGNFSAFVDDISLARQAPPIPPITGGVTGATGVTANAVIMIFAIIAALIGFVIISGGAKGGDSKSIVYGFIIVLVAILFAAIMYGVINA